ncbi:hypothetical protein P691DRAFT_692733 [Macrolepiota fuliginosa MF-IS2]|uniref:Uncharacterized protein n=1 Tax=Macrolepiota fuliginosa MF-IS2 TaxID=1400762 RepID=A0A9P5XPD7_9AGAR|nr:hypothetical protein P691DRAFT_692733 [Macrolepiota fuliginosa MF-IS2]
MTSNFGSLYARLANHFKPHRTEALQRVRVNGVCLVTGVLVSYLLPIPSLHKAIYAVRGSLRDGFGSGEWFYRWFCILEVATFALFLFNVLHGIYAVRYPRASFPPLASPSKPTGIKKAPATPQRSFKLLSPQSSPQPQKPFSFSPSSSFGLSMTSNYPTSPVSTPSRVVHYPAPPNSSTATQASTSSSINILSTPSPVISAYRGKHLSNSVGRALDGSYLGCFVQEKTDEEED